MAFFGPSLGHFLKFFEFEKYQGAYFKYDNSLEKLSPKNNQIRYFWS